VANAVLDGIDGIVLGAETLRGKFPLATVATVRNICRQAEKVFDHNYHFEHLMDAAISANDNNGMGARAGSPVRAAHGFAGSAALSPPAKPCLVLQLPPLLLAPTLLAFTHPTSIARQPRSQIPHSPPPPRPPTIPPTPAATQATATTTTASRRCTPRLTCPARRWAAPAAPTRPSTRPSAP
jgi:hypothetical protein